MARVTDPLDDMHLRLQKVCTEVGIENASQLAVAISKLRGGPTEAAQVSHNGPRGWWTGTRIPDLRNVLDILAVTGASADYLLLDTGPMFLQPAKRRAWR